MRLIRVIFAYLAGNSKSSPRIFPRSSSIPPYFVEFLSAGFFRYYDRSVFFLDTKYLPVYTLSAGEEEVLINNQYVAITVPETFPIRTTDWTVR